MTDGLVELNQPNGKIDPGLKISHGFSPDKQQSQSGLFLENYK